MFSSGKKNVFKCGAVFVWLTVIRRLIYISLSRIYEALIYAVYTIKSMNHHKIKQK